MSQPVTSPAVTHGIMRILHGQLVADRWAAARPQAGNVAANLAVLVCLFGIIAAGVVLTVGVWFQ